MRYFEDVDFAKTTAEDHFPHIQDFFTCLRDALLHLQPANCKVKKECIKYLV